MIGQYEQLNEFDLKKKELKQQIEEVVGQRKMGAASKLIAEFCRQGNLRDELFLACDWYRRLGMYREALGLLKIEKGALGRVYSTESFAGKKLLWLCRVLNLLGAPRSALQLTGNLKPVRPEDFRILGIIFLTNHYYERALPFFAELCLGQVPDSNYQNRMDQLAYADCLNGLSQSDKAIEIVAGLRKFAKDRTEAGIYLQALGEYHCQVKSWGPALALLQESQKYFDSSDSTPDRAFLLKWTGFAQFHLGNQKEAAESLDSAFSILISANVKEEAWLEVLKLKKMLGLLNESEITRYEMFLQILTNASSVQGQNYDRIGNAEAPICVRWKAEEVQVKIKGKAKTGIRCERSLGLTKEIQLLCLLKVTEDWGLGVFRAFEILWPDEVSSLFFAEQRLTDLIQRLKKNFRLDIRIKNQKIYIAKLCAKKVQLENIFGKAQPSLFDIQDQFRIQEVMAHFLISRSAASSWIEKWRIAGLITEVKSAEKIKRYRLVK